MADQYLPSAERGPMTDDEKLAIEFLIGFRFMDANGRETCGYLEPGTKEELKARAAFLRLIQRSNLPEGVRLHLSMLFSPASKIEQRQLVFQFRSSGKRGDVMRDIRLALDVARKVDTGIKVEAAVQEVAGVYGVKRATAFRAWEKHGKRLLTDPVAREAVVRLSDHIIFAGLGIPYPHKE